MNAFHTEHRSGESSPFPLPQLSCRTLLRFTILRALAFKWIRIIARCRQDNTDYDEARHINRLIAANVAWASPLKEKLSKA